MTVDIGARWSARQLAMLRAMGIDFGAREREADPAEPPSPAAESSRRAAPKPAPPAAAASGGPTAPPRSAEPPAAPDRIERYLGDLSVATAARAAPPPADVAVQPAHWLVVSEPLPQGSPSAKLLLAMLGAVGLRSADHGQDKAPGARRAAIAMIEPGADLAFDRARLMDAVQRAAPRCIVVFGRAPARALLSTELPLAELRGKVHRLGETPVVVSYAVPYLLRQPAEKARAWEDLCLAVRACEAER